MCSATVVVTLPVAEHSLLSVTYLLLIGVILRFEGLSLYFEEFHSVQSPL